MVRDPHPGLVWSPPSAASGQTPVTLAIRVKWLENMRRVGRHCGNVAHQAQSLGKEVKHRGGVEGKGQILLAHTNFWVFWLFWFFGFLFHFFPPGDNYMCCKVK